MSTRRARAGAILLASALTVTASACSSGHRTATPAATTTTLPAGAVTVDDWVPPVIAGPASATNFCAALTAIYRHEAALPHVLSRSLAERFLSDYVGYAPTVVAEAPPGIEPAASLYIHSVAEYLAKFIAARLDLADLPPGSLTTLASAPVNEAYRTLSGYSTSTCRYTIGGTIDG